MSLARHLLQASASHLPLADESVQCVVTSPPYWGLRQYAGEQREVWGGDADCAHEWGGIAVDAIDGVWMVAFSELAARIEAGGVPMHTYQRRRDDRAGNARDSYLFDVRTFHEVKRWSYAS